MHVKPIFFFFFLIFPKNPTCKCAISCLLNAIVPFLETPAHRHCNFCSQRACDIMEDAPQDTDTRQCFFYSVCVSARLVLPCTCSWPKIAQCHIWLPSYALALGTRPPLVTLEAGQPLHISRTGRRAPHLSAAVVQWLTTFFSVLSSEPIVRRAAMPKVKVPGELGGPEDTAVALQLKTRL